MAYVPQFKNDIFVSYRHVSNDGQDKWVDVFCEQLRVSLAEAVGDIEIWRDTAELRAGDKWRPEIDDALQSTAIFLAIISGSYFDSEVCRIELDNFLGRAKDAAEAAQHRIVPIFKQPASKDELPPELGEFQDHRFFEYRPPDSHHFQEFRPGKDEETAPLFLSKLAMLAQDLGATLKLLKGIAREHAIGTVYLAQVGPELQPEREKLRSDLQQRGYLVLPERRYFWNASDFRERITRDLDAAQLCVHQVARTASIEPKTAERSRLQLELATEAMKRSAKPPPIVWIQPAGGTNSEAQPLIDYITKSLANEGVEYSERSLEDFKNEIYDKLAPALPSRTAAVALLVEEGDIAATGAITGLLADTLKLEPNRIKFCGPGPKDPASLARTLSRCGKCVVYWGAQPEEWVSEVLALDVLAGYVNSRELCVYAAPPSSPEKSTFRTSKARLIQPASDAGYAALQEFLAGEARR